MNTISPFARSLLPKIHVPILEATYEGNLHRLSPEQKNYLMGKKKLL